MSKPIQGELLWTNPNMSASSFDAQTITLSKSMTNYRFLVIAFKNYYLHGLQYQFVPNFLSTSTVSSSNDMGELICAENSYVKSRYFKIVGTTQIEFGSAYDGNYGSSQSGGNTPFINNGIMIPCYVYGVII